MSPSTESTWIRPEIDATAVNRFADELGCPEAIAAILHSRGLDSPEDARQFLHPTLEDCYDPFDLPDIDPAVDRLHSAIAHQESILVFADRDIDGVSGAGILVTLLEDYNAEVDYLIPDKYDGYGLSEDHIDEAASRGTDLVVTVDAGTTAHDPIDRATSTGIDVIVTDHHVPEEGLPHARSIVNPSRNDSDYPNPDLAGGAVAYKLGEAFLQRHDDDTLDEFRRFGLPLAALATLGDYRDLTIENRAIVREGFERLDTCQLPGLLQTAEHVGVSTMKDLGWSLIPLLNAAQEDRAGEFMLEVMLDHGNWQTDIETLETYRQQRREQRQEQREHLEECVRQQCNPHEDAIFIIETEQYTGSSAMHAISEQWGKPVVTYRPKNGHYQGGGRSDPDVDFVELFEACSEWLDDYWGHPGAAGFRVSSDNLEPFRERLRTVFSERYDTEDLGPTLEIDAVLEPTEIDNSLPDQLQALAPFGNGNPEPMICVPGVKIIECETFGNNDAHLKLLPNDGLGFSAISWNGSDAFEGIEVPVSLDIVGTIESDDFAGQPRIVIEDLRRAEG